MLFNFHVVLISISLGWVFLPAAQGNYSKLLQNFYVYT